ncbi:MAG: glucose-1-phosphate cytidylyltransferase [Candidatus Paceibacterota bacterium]
MKTIILCGGKGTRLAEETAIRPKPMIEIGGRPILWHIMKHYAHHQFKEFVIALGYKGEEIKRYFLDYARLNCNFTIQLPSGDIMRKNVCQDDWTIHMTDTGQETMTGGRIKRAAPALSNETFMMTYGDGVANVNLTALVDFHRKHGKLATLTAVHPPSRFGEVVFDGDQVVAFSEKPQTGEGWINGGYFVLEPGVIDYIEGDDTLWEHEPLHRLVSDGQLMVYRHDGFWQCMDTLRDRRLLERLWATGDIPWRVEA